MDAQVNYTLVGSFIIILTLVSFGLIVWLTRPDSTQTYQSYRIDMNESVSGLEPQAKVSFNGVRVGQVKSIKLNPHNPKQVTLLVDIQAGTPINQSTIATLKSQGITGVTYIELKATRAKAPPLVKRAHQKYPIIRSQPSLLETLSQSVKDSAQHIATMSQSVERLISEKNQKAFTQTLSHVAQLTQTLAQHQKKLDQIIYAMHTFFTNLAITTQDFPQTMERINHALEAFDAMSQEILLTGKTIHKTITHSQVILQNLSAQWMPQTIQTMQHIDSTLKSVQQFTQKLTSNPSMLIRGRAPRALGPGEET